ncbi:cytochrome c biogenesis protein ResB [Geminisphaera colitermitum]|uniref:cytochrome c biogenesis protein ResB n=1 Tax=Geminisphaera colitermitum TaxID=1148786 RepID=UPI0001965152|nr:cytochrome c biogenesis protein ResB [Geminisphaera colitermitum]
MTRAWWQQPWSYRESFVTAAGLAVAGGALQLALHGRGVPEIASPANLILLTAFILFIGALHFLAGSTATVRWLRSVPVAIGALTLLLAQAVVLGIVPQHAPHPGHVAHATHSLAEHLGFTDVVHSWAFVFMLAWLLLNLGLTTLARAFPFRRANLCFLLNHLGLWIALAAGMLGAGDLHRLTMDLRLGATEWRALETASGATHAGHLLEMPFALELTRFDMETFPPRLALADPRTGDIVQRHAGETPRQITDLLPPDDATPDPASSAAHIFGDWTVDILEYHPWARDFGGRYHGIPESLAHNEPGAAPAALIRATRRADGHAVTGWVSCGSFAVNPALLALDNDNALALGMLPPEPKKYSSAVNTYVRNRDGSGARTGSAMIEVNKPLTLAGWKIYQLSYDDRLGRWSPLSVVELVRDPWLPAIYTGIFMMIAGAIGLMFKSKASPPPPRPTHDP